MSDNTKLDMDVFEADVPFGRNRLLKTLGATLFGSAISALGAARIDASCSGAEGCRAGPCTHRLLSECWGELSVLSMPTFMRPVGAR